MPLAIEARLRGPFGLQRWNNRTRIAEYPWAFHATPVEAGMTALEIGGSLAGFQFVLSRLGLEVTNLDPGEAAERGWPLDESTFALLNRAFRTKVQLRKSFLEEAEFADDSFDRIYCISTIEHIPETRLSSLLQEIGRVLRPGGHCVLTIDLFLDLAPFTDRSSNRHGTNVDVRALVEASGLTLTAGNESELNGFPEFRPREVQERLDEYFLGDIGPCVSQLLVLSKRSSG